MLYVNGLLTRLFSIESFVSNGRFQETYSRGNVRLQFRPDISVDIHLPHVPPGTYVSREIAEIPDDIHVGRDLVDPSFEHGVRTHIHRDYRIADAFIDIDNVTSTSGTNPITFDSGVTSRDLDQDLL